MTDIQILFNIHSLQIKINVIEEFCKESKEILNEIEKELNKKVFG